MEHREELLIYTKTAAEIYEEYGTMSMQIYINDLLRGGDITLDEAKLMYKALNGLAYW